MKLDIGHTWDGQPVGADERASVRLVPAGDAWLMQVDAPFHGDPPPRFAPGATPGLWDHEVVECFLSGPAHDAERVEYLEIEVGPFGHHLALRLRGVRKPYQMGMPLSVTTRRVGGRWTAEARIPASWLPTGPLAVNAYAIHGGGEHRRYLCATPLPGPKPDFHQPARFPPLTGPAAPRPG